MNYRIDENSTNYPCTVVKIGTVHDIEGADNIKRVVLFGNNVIVSKDVVEGDVMLYFVTGTQLSEGVCFTNNLYDDSQLNVDSEKKGYISAKRRLVKSVNLRGVISDGLLLPIDALNFIGDLSQDFKVGDTFTHINDNEICLKYVPKSAEKSQKEPSEKKVKGNKLKDLVIDNQFRFHFETKHFSRNLDKFSPNTEVIITRKYHGCLPPSQQIKKYDGSNIQIKDIKVGDKVLGFNHKTNKFEETTVTEVFKNGDGGEWLQISKAIDGIRRGEITEKLICTPEHKIYKQGSGYVKASELQVGDRVISFNSSFKIPKEAEEFVIGKVLGDGSLSLKQGKRRTLSISHKIDHEEYLHHCRNIIDFWTENIDTRISGYGTTMIRSISKENTYFTKLSEKFIKNGKKVFPKDLELTPIILAYWYMDDGNLAHTEFQKDRANLAICGFTDEESIQNIKISLEKIGFKNFTLYNTNGYNRLRFNHSDAYKLFDMIHEYIPLCMRYKLPEEYRNKEMNLLNGFQVEEEIGLEEGVITNISPKLFLDKSLNRKFDIETELHNYVTGGILVHNSSLILSHVLIYKKPNWIERFIDKYITPLPKTEYGFVWSSGKPRSRMPKGIEAENTDWSTTNPSYYSEDFWKKAYRLHKDKVEKGISIYAEIVGQGVQGSEYTYGFEYEIFVYRITQTNSDGNVYEFSWEAVKQYCEKYGLRYVDEYFKGRVSELAGDKEGEDLLETLKEKYLDKKYPDCRVDEGVVIRIRDTDEIFKLKSPSFILKEAGDLEKGVEQTES